MSTLLIERPLGRIAQPLDQGRRIPEKHSYRVLETWIDVVGGWIQRYRQRQVLRELAIHDPHHLTDIGVTRSEALREAAKPFWR